MKRDLTLIPRNITDRTCYPHAFEIAYKAGHADRALATVIHKTLLAMAQSDMDTYQTPSGNVKAKTRPRCLVERARLDTLLDVLADWDQHPLGSTTVLVENTLRRHLYDRDDAWVATASHSYNHKAIDY